MNGSLTLKVLLLGDRNVGKTLFSDLLMNPNNMLQ